ncbi:MAG: magnesium transporter [Nitrospinota bacterium]
MRAPEMVSAREQRLALAHGSLRRLLRRGAREHIVKMTEKLHPAEIAHVLRHLETEERRALFGFIEDPSVASEVLSESDAGVCQEILEALPDERVARLFHEISADDLTDIFALLPEERARKVMELVRWTHGDSVKKLLMHPPDTAGGIMTPDFVGLPQEMSVEDAIGEVRRASEAEMVFYIYVVDQGGRLVGVISLRQLLLAPPGRMLRDVMTRPVWSVRSDTDQEEVARLVARYNILAIPVVDEANRLVGIVTVDDVIDVIREEATEDILKMAGTDDKEITSRSLLESVRLRMPWLLVTLLGGVVAMELLNRFSSSLARYFFLPAFIPAIMGMGGNVGTQSATIVVRGLATGRLDPKNWGRIVWRELRVGLALGLCYGVLLGLVAQIQFAEVATLGLAVGLALCSQMTTSAAVAALMPLALQRWHVDPAVATGPFVTTGVDILGILIYFGIALLLLP